MEVTSCRDAAIKSNVQFKIDSNSGHLFGKSLRAKQRILRVYRPNHRDSHTTASPLHSSTTTSRFNYPSRYLIQDIGKEYTSCLLYMQADNDIRKPTAAAVQKCYNTCPRAAEYVRRPVMYRYRYIKVYLSLHPIESQSEPNKIASPCSSLQEEERSYGRKKTKAKAKNTFLPGGDVAHREQTSGGGKPSPPDTVAASRRRTCIMSWPSASKTARTDIMSTSAGENTTSHS